MDKLIKRGKIKSILTHLCIILFKIADKIDSTIIKNVMLNNFKSKYQYSENKNEKYLLFANDGGISRQLYIYDEYNLKTLKKLLKFLVK